MIGKIRIKSPEEFGESLKNYFNKDRKFVLVWSLILGVITHFLLLTNLIMSQDGLLNGIHYTAGAYEATLGRWGINIVDSFRNNISFPFITTLISIVVMAFISLLLTEIFEIKSKTSKIFTVLSVVASPSLCITLLYTYTADAYLVAMFLSVFTVYALYKIKSPKTGIPLAIVSFVFTMAIYQSYMGITIGLILMLAVKRLLSGESTVLEAVKDIFSKAVIIIVSAIMYFITTKILLETKGLALSGYGGLSQISLAAIFGNFIPSIKSAYMSFAKFFFADGIILNRTWGRDKLYLAFFAVYAVGMLILFVRGMKNAENKKKFWGKYIFVGIIILALPMALNLVLIAAPGNQIYYLTSTQMMLMIPFVFAIFEKTLNINKSNFVNLLNWALIIITLIIMLTYFFTIAVTYETIELSFNQAKSVATRILTRMEEIPGYRAGMKSMFVGVIDDINFPKTMDIYNFAITNSFRGSILHGTYYGQQSTWTNFMNIFCGQQLYYCEDYEYYNIINSEEFEKMEIFPGEDSVKIINDVMVVKFTDTPQVPPYSENMQLHGIEAY